MCSRRLPPPRRRRPRRPKDEPLSLCRARPCDALYGSRRARAMTFSDERLMAVVDDDITQAHLLLCIVPYLGPSPQARRCSAAFSGSASTSLSFSRFYVLVMAGFLDAIRRARARGGSGGHADAIDWHRRLPLTRVAFRSLVSRSLYLVPPSPLTISSFSSVIETLRIFCVSVASGRVGMAVTARVLQGS